MRLVGAGTGRRHSTPPNPADYPNSTTVLPLPLSALRRSCGSRSLRSGGPGRGYRGVGLTFPSLQPTRAGLTDGSTSGHRATPGGNTLSYEGGEVTGGVQIPVQDQTTNTTGVRPLGQGQFGFHRTTTRAGLRRRIPPISNHQPTTVPHRLVRQLPPQRPETGVRDVPGQTP